MRWKRVSGMVAKARPGLQSGDCKILIGDAREIHVPMLKSTIEIAQRSPRESAWLEVKVAKVRRSSTAGLSTKLWGFLKKGTSR